jgi:aminocarboxymuconate-semialdehyde decarboxylase
MNVDVHAHIVVPEIVRDAAPDESWRPHVAWEDGSQVIDLAGRRILSAVREFVDPERLLAEQAAMGIGLTLLSPWVSLTFYDADPEEGLARSRLQNDALSRIAAASGGRALAVGTVPMQDPALAAAELERVMALPRMRGVQLAASVGGTYLGDERFDPFWQAAERLGAVVLVHPTTRGFQLPVLEAHYLWNTVGNPLETAVTAAHMTMTGLLERRPALRIVLAHGGGAFLAVRGRLRHSHTFQPQARSKLETSPLDSIRRFHYDTVMHDAGLLRDLVGVVGADHVLLGSDYPFDMGTTRPIEEVRELGLAREDEALILGGNASRLLEPDR